MHLFAKNTPPQNEYLKKYIKMSTRFQNVGIIIVVISILVHQLGIPSLRNVSLLIFAIGAISLVFGGSSLQPHNLIKSFAQQCSYSPDDILAAGLLEAMERNQKTSLTKTSLNIVYTAIETYASLPDADQDLVEKLRNASQKNLTKKFF